VPVYLTEYNVIQVFNGQEMSDHSLDYGELNAITELSGKLVQVGVYENTVFVTDPSTGEPIGGTFDALGVEVVALTAGTAAGKVLGVTVTADGSVQAWDLATAEPYGTAGRDLVQAVVGVQLIELDGKPVALLLGDQGLTLFDLDTGAQIGETVAPHSGDDAIKSADVAVVDGHDVVVTGSGLGDVQVWGL
jgi:WD40 repeat protein